MSRMVNLRFSLLAFIGIALGIYCSVEIAYANYLPLILTLFAITCICVALAVFKIKKWHIVAVLLAGMLIGLGSTLICLKSQNDAEIVDEHVAVTGRLTDYRQNGKETYCLYLTDCTLQGESLKGKVKVVVYDVEDFEVGDRLEATGVLNSCYFLKNRPDTTLLRDGVRYELAAESVMRVGLDNLGIDEIVRKYVWETCDERMENADIAYALLTGDRFPLDELKVEVFKNSGIIHLLAVSGLHVGVLSGVVLFFVKRLRLPVVWELLLCLLPLAFYVYICGFSPSIVRATLMFICVYVSKLLRGRYDLLTSLGWAAVIILTFEPLYLYDVGFQLSFLSVYGIATLYLSVKRRVKVKGKFMGKVWDSLLLSFSCSLATFLSVMATFGQASLVGLVFNLVAIPLVSVAFVLSLFGQIPWIFRYLLVAADFLLKIVSDAAAWLTDLPFATVSFKVGAAVVLVVIAWLFVVGGYVRKTRLTKLFHAACAVAIALSVLFAYLPEQPQNQAYVIQDYHENAVVVTSAEGDAVVVADFTSEYMLEEITAYLSRYSPRSLTVCLGSFYQANTEYLQAFHRDCHPISKIYALDQSGNDAAELWAVQNGISVVHCVPNVTLGDAIRVQACYDGAFRAACVTVGRLTVASVYGKAAAIHNFAVARSDIDVLVAKDFGDFLYPSATYLSLYSSKDVPSLGTNKYGSFTITEKDDKIVLKFR